MDDVDGWVDDYFNFSYYNYLVITARFFVKRKLDSI